MSLKMNETNHWQLPDGGELHSGEQIELLIDGKWVPGVIEYRPRRSYVLILEDGQERAISEHLEVRSRERPWAR
jgi:hypothetical protein